MDISNKRPLYTLTLKLRSCKLFGSLEHHHSKGFTNQNAALPSCAFSFVERQKASAPVLTNSLHGLGLTANIFESGPMPTP